MVCDRRKSLWLQRWRGAIRRNDPNTLDMLLAFYWESFFRKDSLFLIFFLGSNAAGLSIIWTLSCLHKWEMLTWESIYSCPWNWESWTFLFFLIDFGTVSVLLLQIFSFLITYISAQYFNESLLSKHTYLHCEATGCLVQEKAIGAEVWTLSWRFHSMVVPRMSVWMWLAVGRIIEAWL